MKRLAILGIIASLSLLFAPASVVGDPGGPPGGMDVNVVNTDPLPVTGDVNATVIGGVDVKNTPNVTVTNNSENPVPVTVKNDALTVEISNAFGFIGYSSRTTDGHAVGYDTMYEWCQRDFGLNARMCTTEEFFKSPNIVPPPATPGDPVAWVQPTILSVFYTGEQASSYFYAEPWAGAVPLGNRDCAFWTSNYEGDYGLAIRGTQIDVLGVYGTRCSTEAHVTCCVPINSPTQ
jgi:hypothetical protein